MRYFILFVFIIFAFSPGFSFAEDSRSIEDQAFEESLKQLMPMTPEQIEAYKGKIEETQRAIKIKTPPKVSERTRRISLQPGGKAPVVNIVPGYVSSLAFFDLTGEPWPITSISTGNPQAYSVQKPELKDGNIITISALREHSSSNLVITLAEYSMPFSVQVVTDIEQAESTDALVAFRAEKRGPLAKDPVVGAKLKSTISDTLLGFLDFIPPADAVYLNKKPELEGVDIWRYNSVYYVRSQHMLTWPAYTETARGSGGISVYAVPEVPEIVISKNGELTSIEVKEN